MLSHEIRHLKPAYPIATPKRLAPLLNYNARFRKMDDDESLDSCSSRLASRPSTPTSGGGLSPSSGLSPSGSGAASTSDSTTSGPTPTPTASGPTSTASAPTSTASTPAPTPAPTASAPAPAPTPTSTASGPAHTPAPTPQDDYLSFIEPAPVEPPAYATLPPGGCPRYPVFRNVHGEALPPYLPSAYKLGAASRKIEWLSPYEPATSRSWKTVIVELNSTQLNFYAVPASLEPHVAAFAATQPLESRSSMDRADASYALIKLATTSDSDLQFFKYCERLGLLPDDGLGRCRLVRSYLLQHARVGLATDYKKKSDVLRLRVESEQLLLHFAATKDVIDWHLALSIGKDLALDLQDRELPRYRTVPRRRRRRTVGERGCQGEFTRARAQSDPGERLAGLFLRLRLRFRRERADAECVPPPAPPREHDDEPRLSDLNCSDDDEVDADDSDSDADDAAPRPRRNTLPRSEYVKWRPPLEKTPSERRHYRSCLRCIKPLTHEDTWISKHLVKPTTVSPLSFHYLKAVKYSAAIDSPCSASSTSLASMSSNYSALSLGGRKRSFSLNKDTTLTVPDSALSKIPSHFVKEYIVGSHGLIPADP